MAIYEYRCNRDGLFEVTLPLGTAPGVIKCSLCGSEATRIISAPMVRSTSRTGWAAAIDRAEKSRYEPEVVTTLPSTGARKRTTVLPLTPTLRGLPRP